jgi:hypothetical protein
MGADLIGHMCVGPRRIARTRTRAAVKRAWEVFQALRRWHGATDGEDPPKGLEFLALCGIDEPWQLESLDFGKTGLNGVTKAHIGDLVGRIVSFWNDPDARDTVWRDISKMERVVFCGDSTWGDEPDGVGHSLLRMAHVLDILDPLGIH